MSWLAGFFFFMAGANFMAALIGPGPTWLSVYGGLGAIGTAVACIFIQNRTARKQ